MAYQNKLVYEDRAYDSGDRRFPLTTGKGFKEIVVRLKGTGASAGTVDTLRQCIDNLELKYKSSTVWDMNGLDARKRKAILHGTQSSLVYSDGGRSVVEFPITLTPNRPKKSTHGIQVERGEPFVLNVDWNDTQISDSFSDTPEIDIVEKRVSNLSDKRFSYVVEERYFPADTSKIEQNINVVNQPFKSIMVNFGTFTGNEDAKIEVGYDNLSGILQQFKLEGQYFNMAESEDLDSNAIDEITALSDEMAIMTNFDPLLNPEKREFPSFDYMIERNSSTEVTVYKEQLRDSTKVE